MQFVKVGDLECIVAKTGESLFILGVSGAYMDNDGGYSINNLGTVNLNQINLCIQTTMSMDWNNIYPKMVTSRFYIHHNRYEHGHTLSKTEHYPSQNLTGMYKELYAYSTVSTPDMITACAAEDAARHPTNPEPQENAKKLKDLYSTIQGHLPKHFMDVVGVRIVLDATTKSLSPEDIITHAVTNNQSSITIGSIRMSWENDDAMIKGEFKYKYRTCRAALDEIIKLHRAWMVALEDAKLPYKVFNEMYIDVNRDPKVTNTEHGGYNSIDYMLSSAEQAISKNTDRIRAYLSSAVASTVKYRKVIYVKGWEIVAGYQSLNCESCMVGRMDDYDTYLVEPYAHSPACTLALYIETYREDDIREHLADVANKCQRGRRSSEDEWYHSGIIARSMVWDIKDHGEPEAPKGWYDRMYVNSGERASKKTTTFNSFAAAMEAEGYKAWRTVGATIRSKGYLVLSSVDDGGWDTDEWLGLPYMDSFECGWIKPNGIVWCYPSRSAAVDHGAPGKKLISLKCSGGLQEMPNVRYVTCGCCGESYHEDDNPLDAIMTRDGMVDICSGCREDYVRLDAMYNRRNMRVYEHQDNCFFCESTDTYFLDGDDVPEHIQLDNGDWVHEASDEAMEYLATQAKEFKKEDVTEKEEEQVSCIYDADDLRRRRNMPQSACIYDSARGVWVDRAQWDRYLARMVSLGEPVTPNIIHSLPTVDDGVVTYSSRATTQDIWRIDYPDTMINDIRRAMAIVNDNRIAAMIGPTREVV